MIYWVIASPSILTTLVILIINCNEMDLRGIIVLTASIIITIIIGFVIQNWLVERNVKLLEKRLEETTRQLRELHGNDTELKENAQEIISAIGRDSRCTLTVQIDEVKELLEQLKEK